MITLRQKIEDIISTSPYLKEALSMGMINLSSLARELKPQIEEELIKVSSESAIFMALSRYAKTLQKDPVSNPAKYIGNLSLITDLFEVTAKNSLTLTGKIRQLLRTITQDRSTFFVSTQGLYETTIVASQSQHDAIMDALTGEEIIQVYTDLTAISLQRVGKHISAVGVMQYPLRIIAWQGIAIVEIISTLNELMIILRDEDVDRAVIAIRRELRKNRKV